MLEADIDIGQWELSITALGGQLLWGSNLAIFNKGEEVLSL